MTSPDRISLASVSKSTGALLAPGDSTSLTDQTHPTVADLTECLFFSPGDGRIWLNDRRMVLLDNATLGSLRRELIERLGRDKARGLLTRAGYTSGVRDAQLVRDKWPGAEPAAMLAAGMKLAALEGMVKVQHLHYEFDPDQGRFSGEFLWHHSSEDDENIAAYGIGVEPACWMQLGYACGYVTALLGRLTIFREVECRSTGHSVCRLFGKSADLWGNVEEDLYYLNAEGFVSTTAYGSSRSRVAALPDLSEDVPDPKRKHMVGMSSAFNAACHMLRRVAPTRATVLFVGESGVGKELFAQMLHEISPRSAGPFVSINCAAIPDTLVESELFGVDRGAYTGATVARAGRFERANGGTLFLDEIASLSLVAQGKLLRALQEGEIDRVGGSRSISVDVRVVAASNVDLREEVVQGRFREDLFFRLNVFPIHLPPLRERRDDIPLLMSHFLHRYNQLHGRQVTGFTTRAVRALLNYRFPGNIRELQNLVERGVIAAEDGAPIDLPHLFRSGEAPDELAFSVGPGGGLAQEDPEAAKPAASLLDRFIGAAGDSGETEWSLELLEAGLIREAVERTGGNLAAAARLLGLTRPQLAYRLGKYGDTPYGRTDAPTAT